ncbi:MAG: intracellular sulfur oxidation DsrE/DsrF family protein [Methylophagaceae bacterium]
METLNNAKQLVIRDEIDDNGFKSAGRDDERVRQFDIGENMKHLMVLMMAIAMSVGLVQAELHEDKPFAETHIIMQVSDADPVHYRAVLDIANNLTKRYGQEMVDIEVIAFGVGVPMVFAEDNEFTARIESLQKHGVRFYVCGNTLDSLERKNHMRPTVLSGVGMVQTGVKFLIDEIQKGYIPIHP